MDTPLEVDTKIANALLGLAPRPSSQQLASRDASISALQGAKADATLLASYATNAALSASETTLQSALDAILAELAALQLSGSGGVVNAPAWAGFTTWELVRGSNVVRNLHLEAPLSAALANGDDTLSITADCYSVAAADAALTAALLAYYTSAQVDALLADYRTACAQDTQTQAAIAGALLAYRTGPDQDVSTTNQITLALVAYRSAADQDTATASSVAAALLSYYTVAQVDGGCSVVLATHTAGAVSVDGYTLTLAANPWNIVRTYNLTPGRELLFACRYRLDTASNFVVYMSEADNVYDPLYGSFAGDQGAWSTAKMYFTLPPNGIAKLHFQAPGLPNQTAGTVDVYGLQILDATLEAGNTTEVEEDTAASALLLKHEFLDGGADDVTLATLGEGGRLVLWLWVGCLFGGVRFVLLLHACSLCSLGAACCWFACLLCAVLRFCWFLLVTTRHPFWFVLVPAGGNRFALGTGGDKADKVVSSCWWVRACFILPETLFQTLSHI